MVYLIRLLFLIGLASKTYLYICTRDIASVILVILHYYLFRNKECQSHSLCMTSVVVLFAFPIKLSISKTKGVTKILPKKSYSYFNWLPNSVINCWTKFRLISTLIKLSFFSLLLGTDRQTHQLKHFKNLRSSYNVLA